MWSHRNENTDFKAYYSNSKWGRVTYLPEQLPSSLKTVVVIITLHRVDGCSSTNQDLGSYNKQKFKCLQLNVKSNPRVRHADTVYKAQLYQENSGCCDITVSFIHCMGLCSLSYNTAELISALASFLHCGWLHAPHHGHCGEVTPQEEESKTYQQDGSTTV